jgi:RHH-type proline utilization regulon transcriptional repressor/proline dehydrogenase/delta 1-pyrroline-5-carboxylate dehydrogenase
MAWFRRKNVEGARGASGAISGATTGAAPIASASSGDAARGHAHGTNGSGAHVGAHGATTVHRIASRDADESQILTIGRDMLSRAKAHKGGLLSAGFYKDALMEWSMKDPNFKVQMFRFVDAFPVLRDAEDTFDHLQDYLSQPGVTVPTVIQGAMTLGKLAKGPAVATIGGQIRGMAGRFIAGSDAASALGNLQTLWKSGIAFSVDLLGEACLSDEEADAYQRKYLDLITNLPAQVSAWGRNARLESDHLGGVPRTNVSVKISSLSARCDPIDREGTLNDLMKRLLPILEAARERGVFVNFDMEQFALKDFTLELFERCCERVDFHAGLAMQAYLRSGVEDARRVCDWSRRTGRVVTVRLVKGAYWDYEVINAEQRGWPTPVWATKRQTDACFERMAAVFLDACPRSDGAGSNAAHANGQSSTSALGPTRLAPGAGGVKLALGSHNVRSIAAAVAGLRRRGLPESALELQMLHGMADQLKSAAAEMGLRVREYVPVGQMIPGMAYLVRRLLENTSNESWLKAGFLDNADETKLLASPHAAEDEAPDARRGDAGIDLEGGGSSPGLLPERHMLTPAVAELGLRPFVNEALRDFSDRAQHAQFASAVASARVPSIANDTGVDRAGQMVGAAMAAFEGAPGKVGWRDTDVAVRARVLLRAAGIMRRRRDELSAIMVREAGKTWREADGDTCEAIDFCEYYARLAVPLFRPERLGRFIGELDEQWCQARGVAVVIAPWNFPLAICCGMSVAALVTGNTLIVKPAEQTPAIAKLMVDVLHEALAGEGLGALAQSVVQFCPAPGETTGAALVRDPRVAIVAFTGSRDVGCDILHAAAPASPFAGDRAAFEAWANGPHAHVKRVVCEMGGKNAIIVDTSADPDETVVGVRASAFGFQGQKCSACSRLIVVDPAGPEGPAITRLRERLIEATKALTIGDAAKPGTDVGPVIDAEAKAKIEGFVARAKASGLSTFQLAVPAGLEASTGRAFVGPAICWTVAPEHELANAEVFGPVLAIMHAKSFDEALRLANASAYKLTGGVFSRKPSHLTRARREFRVGNLYINRGITGALVGRQPFGGFGMSGVGAKAGGRDYLLQFVEPRAVCENTMRRGFAPEL